MQNSIRCLFAIEDAIPLTPNSTGGASALAYSHLKLLADSGYVGVHLVVFCRELPSPHFTAYTNNHPTEWAQVQDWCTTYHLVQLEFEYSSGPVRNFLHRMANPAYPFTGIKKSTQDVLDTLIKDINPSLIWAQDLTLASIAQKYYADRKIVYSHFDWKWKIKSHRTKDRGAVSLRKKINYYLSRRHEENLVKQVTACVSGSASEVEQIRQLGTKNIGYFPTVYQPTVAPSNDIPKDPRIVHLGGMQTTANRIGLKRFLKVVWSELQKNCLSPPPLWVIGSLKGADDELCQLLEESGAICTNFVEDLATVLRPYDLHIIPWEFDTGTRTRIPLVLSYGQVLVCTRASAMSLPELEHRKNVVLVDDLNGMANALVQLLSDTQRRQSLGTAGHQLFIECYTTSAVQARFKVFLNEII